MFFILFVFLIHSVHCSCPTGYTFNSDFQKCYKVYEQPQTYFAAAHACTMDGTQLVSIHSSNENAYVNGLVPDQFGYNHWIGLNLLVGGFDWEWLDDSTVDYAEWGTGQPAQPSNCSILEYDTNRWLSQDCDAKLPYICNIRLKTCPTPSPRGPAAAP